jgi:GT2 family glycosyltransferase
VDFVQALAKDLRVRVIRSAANGGIVQASNAALALATGAFVGFLDHDDELAPEALEEVVARLNEEPALDVIYTDEDKIDESGTHSQPHFKPGWSPELLRSCMYLSHFTVMRRALVHSLDGFRAGTDGAQDYDLALRATAATTRIAHIPKVLYHWRISAGSGAGSQLGKPWALEAGRRVLIDDAARTGLDVVILPAEAGGHYRTRRRDPQGPKVSVIVSKPPGLTADQFSARLKAITARTTYRNLEIIACATTINDAVRAAGGEHIVLLDGTTTPEDTGWVNALLDACPRPDVGVTSGLVLSAEGLIESAGLVLAADGTPLPAFHGEPSWARGHRSNLVDVRNCAAVDRVCLLTSRAAFERLGGIDERAWPRAYSVDYSLRARRENLRVAVTPYAQFRRGQDSAREEISAEEMKRLRAAWGSALQQDPYYNPNFDRGAASFRLPDRSLKEPAT